MKNKAIFIWILVIIFVALIFLFFAFQNEKKENNVLDEEKTEEYGETELGKTEVVETNSVEEKTTPNTLLIIKKEYSDCGHTIENRASIPEEMVNLTKEELKQKYQNWEIEEFSKEKVVLFIRLESFCGEHYFLTEEERKNSYIYSR